jgi:hypothetical protein
VSEQFPGSLGVDDFIHRLEIGLFSYGFSGENSIGREYSHHVGWLGAEVAEKECRDQDHIFPCTLSCPVHCGRLYLDAQSIQVCRWLLFASGTRAYHLRKHTADC